MFKPAPSPAPGQNPARQNVARLKLVGWILLAAVVLSLCLLTVRLVLLTQVDRTANGSITEEVAKFVSFAEQGVDPLTGQAFESESELLNSYLTHRSLPEGEVLIAFTGDDTVVLDNTHDGAGESFASAPAIMDRLRYAPEASGSFDSEHYGEIRWGRVNTDVGGSLLTLHFLDDENREVNRDTQVLLLIAAGGLLLTGVLGWFASGRMVQRSGGGPSGGYSYGAGPSPSEGPAGGPGGFGFADGGPAGDVSGPGPYRPLPAVGPADDGTPELAAGQTLGPAGLESAEDPVPHLPHAQWHETVPPTPAMPAGTVLTSPSGKIQRPDRNSGRKAAQGSGQLTEQSLPPQAREMKEAPVEQTAAQEAGAAPAGPAPVAVEDHVEPATLPPQVADYPGDLFDSDSPQDSASPREGGVPQDSASPHDSGLPDELSTSYEPGAQSQRGLSYEWTSAAPLLLRVQRAASAQFPRHQFRLAAQTADGTGVDSDTNHPAVLASLAEHEASMDPGALHSALLEVIDHAAAVSEDRQVTLSAAQVQVKQADPAPHMELAVTFTEAPAAQGAGLGTAEDYTRTQALPRPAFGASTAASPTMMRNVLEQRWNPRKAAASERSPKTPGSEAGEAQSAVGIAVDEAIFGNETFAPAGINTSVPPSRSTTAGADDPLKGAKDVAEAHGGQLWVASEPGHPTVIALQIPIHSSTGGEGGVQGGLGDSGGEDPQSPPAVPPLGLGH